MENPDIFNVKPCSDYRDSRVLTFFALWQTLICYNTTSLSHPLHTQPELYTQHLLLNASFGGNGVFELSALKMGHSYVSWLCQRTSGQRVVPWCHLGRGLLGNGAQMTRCREGLLPLAMHRQHQWVAAHSSSCQMWYTAPQGEEKMFSIRGEKWSLAVRSVEDAREGKGAGI